MNNNKIFTELCKRISYVVEWAYGIFDKDFL